MVREVHLGARAAGHNVHALNSTTMITTRRPMWATLCLLLGGACVAFSQNKPIVLKAARMFDGHRMLTPGMVVVSGSTIQGVGTDAAIPAGAQVMDFGDATLSPGFMDAHTHLSYPANNKHT